MNWLIALSAIFVFTTNALAQEALVPNSKRTPGRVAKRDKELGGVTLAMEKKVFSRYRLPWSRRAEFKIDHLIPVELGGADTVDNLWPQNLSAKPYGTERKELLTEVLLARIRAGQMTLAQAQEQISRDWIDAFIDHLGMVYLK
jgi:hypothetical protein